MRWERRPVASLLRRCGVVGLELDFDVDGLAGLRQDIAHLAAEARERFGVVAQALFGSPLGTPRRRSRVLEFTIGAADDVTPASGRA